MKPVRYTRHARRTVRFWSIDPEEVMATLQNPDRIIPIEKGRLNAIKQFGERFIRVTYIEESDHILVITVTPRKRPW